MYNRIMIDYKVILKFYNLIILAMRQISIFQL